MKTAIVRKADHVIESTYQGSARQSQYGGPWGNSDTHVHLEWDETAMEAVMAQDDGEGGVELVEDVQATREAKLALMRTMRDEKMPEVDIMCNELAVGARTDAAAVKVYRQSLLDITDNYKELDGSASDTLDSLEKDLSDLVWPTEP